MVLKNHEPGASMQTSLVRGVLVPTEPKAKKQRSNIIKNRRHITAVFLCHTISWYHYFSNKKMSTKYKFKDQDKLYFVSFAVVHWIDLFVRNEYKTILLDSWKYCQANKGMELFAWCIMTSHVHMIIGSHGEKLENIMRDMKRHTSETLKKAIKEHSGESRREWMLELMEKAGKENSNNINFQLWRQDNHPIELTTPVIANQKLDYLHYNPVAAGFVEKPEDYLYSSAIDYYTNRNGLIDVQRIDPIVITF